MFKPKKKLNPVFLDIARYSYLCDDIERGKLWDINGARITTVTRKNDFMYIAEEPDRIVFTYSPSNDFLDWIGNFRFMDKASALRYHANFYNSALRFQDIVSRKISDSQAKSIKFNGSSRGGALALFASYFTAVDFPFRHLDLMTFGIPKCLSADERAAFNTKNIHYDNIQNVGDWVTKAGSPIFKTAGIVKTLDPHWSYFIPGNIAGRHRMTSKYGYYYNIKRLTE